MIDEKKLIEELKESGLIADNDYGHAIIDFIRKMPKVGEWIPCSERLPDKDGYFLVAMADNDFDILSYFYSSGSGWDGFEEVIAWQPLPEPYKENADD